MTTRSLINSSKQHIISKPFDEKTHCPVLSLVHQTISVFSV